MPNWCSRGYDEIDDSQQVDIELLFENLEPHEDDLPVSTYQFVQSCRKQFERNGRLSPMQIEVLEEILDRLEALPGNEEFR